MTGDMYIYFEDIAMNADPKYYEDVIRLQNDLLEMEMMGEIKNEI